MEKNKNQQMQCIPGSPECKKCMHHQNCVILKAREHTCQNIKKNDMFWELLREEHEQM